MKRIFIVLVTIVLIVPIFNVNANSPEVDTNYSIKEIYHNDKFSKYEVVENEEKYVLLYDLERQIVVVNDKVYSEKDFEQAIQKQADNSEIDSNTHTTILDYLTGYTYKLNEVNYDFENQQYEEEVLKSWINHSDVGVKGRCNQCRYSASEAPKTGYRTTGGWIDNKNLKNVTISNTAAAVSRLASLFSWAKLSFAQNAMYQFVKFVGKGTIDNYCKGSFRFKQNYHTVCPKACQETREIYVIGKNKQKVYSGKQYNWQFYFLNPFN